MGCLCIVFNADTDKIIKLNYQQNILSKNIIQQKFKRNQAIIGRSVF